MASAEVLESEITPRSEGDDAFYEVVDDQRVEKEPVGAYAIKFAFKLASKIENFAETNDLGQAVTEALFRLRSSPTLQRRPDAAYISYERWSRGENTPVGNAWDVIPDLIVEVVSPTNLAEEIPTRVREYFEAGVRRAWVVYLHESLVYDYESPRSIRVLGVEDVLDGREVIPGFQIPLAKLFEKPKGTLPS